MPIFITELSLRLTYFYTSNVQLALRSPFIPSQYTAFHHLRLSVKLIIGITCSSSSVYSHFITLKYKCQYFFTFLFIFSKTFQKLIKTKYTYKKDSQSVLLFGSLFVLTFIMQVFLFARAASVAKPSLSFTASSASIFLLISTFASFNPCMNLL